MSDAPIRLFTFPAAWGLPTTGPFGLKLELALRILDVPYERVHEMDSRKGPKRKSPWIEQGSLRMGDTELILAHVAEAHGKRLPEGDTAEARARGHVLRRMLEEHYHQVFEYELAVRDEGFAALKAMMIGLVPGLLIGPVAGHFRRTFKKHLFERGIARHSGAEVEAMGKADIDALVALLGENDYFLGDEPTKVDASAFGLLAVTIRSGIETPVMQYARTKPTLVAFVDRVMARYFPEIEAAREAA